MKTLATVALCSLLWACGSEQDDMSVNFSGGNSVKSPSSPRKSEDAVKAPADIVISADPIINDSDATEFFLTDQVRQQIDLVWVIDNSGSMSDEYEKVKDNFDQFVEAVSGDSHLNMAVISSADTNGMDLKGKGVTHVDANVGSSTALQFAAAAFCDESESKADGNIFKDVKVCGSVIDGNAIEQAGIEDAKGKLKDFYRKGSKHVMIVVSDDDASGLTDARFLKTLKYKGITEDLEFYGFIGKDRGSCDMAREGKNYERLARATGGQTYDICDDWSRHFEDLTKSVLTVRKRPLKLMKTPTEVKWVKVGKKILHKSRWELQGDIIVLKNVDLEADDTEITVHYTWK